MEETILFNIPTFQFFDRQTVGSVKNKNSLFSPEVLHTHITVGLMSAA